MRSQGRVGFGVKGALGPGMQRDLNLTGVEQIPKRLSVLFVVEQ